MIDPELNKQLNQINQTLVNIEKNKGFSPWKSFLTGTMAGLGSIIGVAIALTIISYILNAIGVIPAFRSEVNRINQTLDSLKKTR